MCVCVFWGLKFLERFLERFPFFVALVFKMRFGKVCVFVLGEGV